ncbi:MAG: hypothetical protein WBP95_12420 [Acidobacteriaceae bacterium]
MRSSSVALVVKPAADNGVRFPAASVVPASFHPEQKPSLLRKTGAKRNSPSHASPIRQVAAHRSDAPKNPYVMARLAVSDTTEQSLFAPSLVVFETVESSTPGSAQLRTVGADSAAARAQQFQGREDPALQIQVFRAIDPATGMPIQILRIVLVVPQQGGSTAQSI